jgi:peptidyl-prolyl cis-trans isomerase D
MLRYLRNNSDSFFSKLLLFALAAVFVFFFGSGALNSARSELIAEVNGETIRDQEVNRVWRQQVRFQQRFNPKMTETDQQRIRQQVIDNLIEQKLILQAANTAGVAVSPKELRRAIIEDPGFQDDEGNFDLEAYEAYLGDDPGPTERRLQESLRSSLTVQTMQDVVRDGVQVSAAEVENAFVQENSKRNVEFLRVNSSSFASDVVVDDAALAAWASEHDAEVQERYDRDFDRKFNTAKQVSAQHILVKFDEDDGDEAKAEVRTRMEAVLVEVKAEGADFGELAKEYSEDSSAPRGGDLGKFDSKRMVKPFSDAAFDMDVGAISGLVETRYGLHIIKVNEVFEAQVTELADARLEIAKELYGEEKAPEMAREYAVKLVGALDGTLDEEASAALLAEHGLTVQETGEFDQRARTVPKLGRAPEASTAAFALAAAGDVTAAPIELPTGFAVLRLKTATEADMAEFEESRDSIRDRLLRTKQSRALEAWKAQLKEDADIRIAVGA